MKLYYTNSAFGGLKPLTPSLLDSLLDSPRQASLIAQIRASRDENEQSKLKKQLAAAPWQGSLDEELAQRVLGSKAAMKKILGKEVKTNRQQQLMKPTGLFIIDCEAHLSPEATAEERENWALWAYKIITDALKEKNELDRLVYYDRTARWGGHGLLKGRQGSSPEQDIEWIDELTGHQLNIDHVVTDYSRLLFLPTRKDLIFINKDALFSANNEAGYVNQMLIVE